MRSDRTIYIAVIGANQCATEEAKLAAAVGSEIARSGAVLVCGGLGGVMEAACRGAKEAGGVTIGILPGLDRSDANEYVDHVVCTGIGEARNLAVVLSSDGVIALPGEFGTLSEIAFALKHHKPIVSVGSWMVSDRIIAVSTAAEAVQRILQEIA